MNIYPVNTPLGPHHRQVRLYRMATQTGNQFNSNFNFMVTPIDTNIEERGETEEKRWHSVPYKNFESPMNLSCQQQLFNSSPIKAWFRNGSRRTRPRPFLQFHLWSNQSPLKPRRYRPMNRIVNGIEGFHSTKADSDRTSCKKTRWHPGSLLKN